MPGTAGVDSVAKPVEVHWVLAFGRVDDSESEGVADREIEPFGIRP